MSTAQSTGSANASSPLSGLFSGLGINLRSLTMVAALAIIWVYFSVNTDGTFLDPRNLSNLFRQTAVIAFIAIGMVFVIVSGNIDLSVGSLAGLTGAVAALVQVKWLGPWMFDQFPNLPVATISIVLSVVACMAAVALGIVLGWIQGYWTALGGVPAFIVTLAGMLIFRGAILGLTDGITIAPMEPGFKSLGQSYLPMSWGWILAGAFAFAMALSRLRDFKVRRALGLSQNSALYQSSHFLLWIAGAGLFVWVMNLYRGIPTPLLLLLGLAWLMNFLANRTTYGRNIYAIGGNAEAAKLSGIRIPRTIIASFAILGALSAVSGIVLTGRLDAATTNAGNLFELSAIAACVIGGCSLSGGKGSVYGAIIGALVMASLDNGMSLMNVEVFWQQVVKGLVLLLAVWIDHRSRMNERIA